MCTEGVSSCLQTGISCFNTVEYVRNAEAALRTDHNYLEDNLGRLLLIIGEVQKKNVKTPQEIEWLKTAERVPGEVGSILDELRRVLNDKNNFRCWYLICWCDLGRRTSVIRSRLEERLGIPCAQEIEKSIGIFQAQNEPVIRLLDDEQAMFLTERSSNKFWKQFNSGQVIRIHGMIGIGKSTFLKKVNDAFYDDHHGFDMVIFVPQSSNSNIEEEVRRIQREIATRLGTTLPEEPEIRRTTLRRILQGMNVLLLLDNLLHGVTLSSLGVPIPAPPPLPPTDTTEAPHNQPKICKLVFTSRWKLTGSNIGAAIRDMELDLMSKDDARKFLKSKVWQHNCNSQTIRKQQCTDEYGKTKSIEDLADKIADMCDGLPLALDKIGEHLQHKLLPGEWKTELDRLTEPERASAGVPEGRVYACLKEAYNYLRDSQSEYDPSEKKCFLYCSLFPKGEKIEENELKRHWIVEEFLGKVGGRKALDVYFARAVSIFQTLNRAHLLSSSSSSNHQSYVIMHRQVHCMARWVAQSEVREKNFVQSNGNLDELSALLECQRKVKRILLTRSRGNLRKIDCPNLSTLVIRDSVVSKIEADLFDCIQESLRLLDLSICILPVLQLNVVRMSNLQYLNLSHTNITCFPFDLEKLSKLQFLDLSFTKELMVTSLKALSSLADLQLLNLYYCGPCGRSQQSQRGGTFLLLKDVEQLNHLGDLAVTINGDLAFQKLENFSKLNLTHSMVITNCDGIPLKLQFIATAKKLKVLHVIHCLVSLQLPQGAVTAGKCFENLCNVEINDCWRLRDLTWLKYAQALQSLKIANCPVLTEVIDVSPAGRTQPDPLLFDKLRNLKLIDLNQLSSIFFQDLPFSSLESIVVRNCDNLKTIPIAENSDRKMQPAIQCQKRWWQRMGDDARKSRLRPVFHS